MVYIGGVFTAYSSIRGKVALRVDETGVPSGGNPALRSSAASIPYIGLARREGAPAVPGSVRGVVGRATMRALVPPRL